MRAKRKGAPKEQAATKQKSLEKVKPSADIQEATTETEAFAAVAKLFSEATGVNDMKVAALMVSQLRRCAFAGDRDGTEIAFELIREMKPKGLMEAHLAVQMLAVHNTALAYLEKASSPGLPFAGCDTNLARAIELMGLYREQTETMLKLKGKTGQQKVTVEHVHVHQGGQAIVGAVSPQRPTQGGGGSREKQTKTP